MSGYQVVPLPTQVRVRAGDDVADLLLAAARDADLVLADGDVVCVASKVVSKAAGASTPLPAGDDVHAARRQLAIREAVRVVAETPWVLVVETRHGLVCANAGIDTSNVADGLALLLPDDPDGAAAALREQLRTRAGADVGVVITDTFGRPWRLGQTDVAVGAAGITALRDDRGTADLEGRLLEVTMVAVADELAAAADLARAKADGTPFVVLRGLGVAGEGRGADLVRPSHEDVFRYGGPTATEAAVLGAPPPWPEQDWPATLTERMIVASRGAAAEPVRGVSAADLADSPPPGCEDARAAVGFWISTSAVDRDACLIELGRAVERARLVAAAHGAEISWRGSPDDVPLGPHPLAQHDAALADLAPAGVLTAR